MILYFSGTGNSPAVARQRAHLPHKEDINYTRLSKVIEACDEAKGNISAEAVPLNSI